MGVPTAIQEASSLLLAFLAETAVVSRKPPLETLGFKSA